MLVFDLHHGLNWFMPLLRYCSIERERLQRILQKRGSSGSNHRSYGDESMEPAKRERDRRSVDPLRHGKGDPRFARDCQQAVEHWLQQRDARAAPDALGFALGITRNERPTRPGSGSCFPERAYPLVDAPFEFVFINETVNLQSADKM